MGKTKGTLLVGIAIFVALALTIWDPSRAAAVQAQPANEWLEQGKQLFGQGKYDAALEAFSKAIDVSPDFVSAYQWRGASYQRLRNYEAAFNDYQKALQIDPNDAMTYNNLGVFFQDMRQYELAAKAYDRAVELNPKLAMAYANRGSFRADMKDYDGALTDFQRSLELDPTVANTFTLRGSVYQKMNRPDDALWDYGEAIRLDPTMAFAYYNRGNVYQRKGEFDKAIEDYTTALRIKRFPAAFFGRGQAYMYLKKYKEADEDLSQAIEISPKYAKAYRNRASVREAQGRYNEAIQDYTRAVKLDPNDSLAKAGLDALQQSMRVKLTGGPTLKEGVNMLGNPDAGQGVRGWATYNAAVVDECGGNACFVVKDGSAFYQRVDIPDARGWYAVFVARASADSIPTDSPRPIPAGLPTLLGQMESADGKHATAHMRGGTLTFTGSRAGTWEVLWGIFPIEAEGQRIQFRMEQTVWGNDSLAGTTARFDDAGLYFFKTEGAAKNFVGDYRAKMKSNL